ncbi:MAG: hypothetical protein IPL28_19420 [Chloroflexi bacterium]|nr:hypothetical protein [Chloroflexota bacterium]
MSTSLPTPLRARWWGVFFLYGVALLGVWGWLRSTPWGGVEAGRWLGHAALLAMLVWLILGRHLGKNRRVGETAVLPTLG